MRPSTLWVTIAAIDDITPHIKQFTLVASDGRELPPFSGGSHVVVTFSDGGRTFRNPYSLLSSPRALTNYKIAVRLMKPSRGGSEWLHRVATVGMMLEISTPQNLFPLYKTARKQLLLAGGVGVTPMMAMIDDLAASGANWELHYSVRSAGHDRYGLELQSRFGERVRLYYTSGGERIDFATLLAGQPLGTHLYVCGPNNMIDDACGAAALAGWPESNIHVERFTVPSAGLPFDCYLAQSRKYIHVRSDQSLLEAIEAAGVDAPYMCRGGVCGQCETAVLELDGQLVHHDDWLSDEEKAAGDKIMTCVSRAICTRLVLDR
jgi:ferredoxin-NADP reductase